jgi:hypothetical protein
MSTKTIKQRIAVVAASALTAGALSVVSMPVANATAGGLTFITANGPVIVAANTVSSTNAGTITIGSTTSIQIQFTSGDSGAAKANLSLICKRGANRSVEHFFIFTVGKNDAWILATKFQ